MELVADSDDEGVRDKVGTARYCTQDGPAAIALALTSIHWLLAVKVNT